MSVGWDRSQGTCLGRRETSSVLLGLLEPYEYVSVISLLQSIIAYFTHIITYFTATKSQLSSTNEVRRCLPLFMLTGGFPDKLPVVADWLSIFGLEHCSLSGDKTEVPVSTLGHGPLSATLGNVSWFGIQCRMRTWFDHLLRINLFIVDSVLGSQF